MITTGKGARRYKREGEIEMHSSLTHFKNVVSALSA